MSRVSDKFWNSVAGAMREAARKGDIKPELLELENRPTHILDIYKMRRGMYKNVRIWTKIHLGTGYRKDLFMTTAENQPITGIIDLFDSARKIPIIDWEKEL